MSAFTSAAYTSVQTLIISWVFFGMLNNAEIKDISSRIFKPYTLF